jgi:hypothetical protein
MRDRIGALRRLVVFTCMAVGIAALSADGQIDGGASAQDCYENDNQIDPTPLKVSQIHGAVIDPYKVVVPHVLVLLFTEQDHRLIAKTLSDSEGHFSLAKPKNGRYRLVVKLYGLCPANVPITVRTWIDKKQIVVHMNVRSIDSCSYAELQ